MGISGGAACGMPAGADATAVLARLYHENDIKFDDEDIKLEINELRR